MLGRTLEHRPNGFAAPTVLGDPVVAGKYPSHRFEETSLNIRIGAGKPLDVERLTCPQMQLITLEIQVHMEQETWLPGDIQYQIHVGRFRNQPHFEVREICS